MQSVVSCKPLAIGFRETRPRSTRTCHPENRLLSLCLLSAKKPISSAIYFIQNHNPHLLPNNPLYKSNTTQVSRDVKALVYPIHCLQFQKLSVLLWFIAPFSNVIERMFWSKIAHDCRLIWQSSDEGIGDWLFRCYLTRDEVLLHAKLTLAVADILRNVGHFPLRFVTISLRYTCCCVAADRENWHLAC